MKYLDSLQFFYEYCSAFYNNEDGVYPLASVKEIGDAIDEYLSDKKLGDIAFDSHDRWYVREILEARISKAKACAEDNLLPF
jgi:hypothetical protein